MEKSVSFPRDQIDRVILKMTWAQVEVVLGTGDEFQVIATGDDSSVEELRVELKEKALEAAQPPLLNAKGMLPRSKWLQICVRVPQTWRGEVDVDSISGMIGVRKINGTEISASTVSGPIHIRDTESERLMLHNVSGTISGKRLSAQRGNVRTISGKVGLEGIKIEMIKFFTVSGEANLSLDEGVRTLEIQSISGAIGVEVEGGAHASLSSLSGKFIVSEEIAQSEGGVTISASSVTGDLLVKKRDKK